MDFVIIIKNKIMISVCVIRFVMVFVMVFVIPFDCFVRDVDPVREYL